MVRRRRFYGGVYSKDFIRMTTGLYDELTGNLELSAIKGEPEIFVIAGMGTGTMYFRYLQRQRIPFAAGILWENDLDYTAASALSSVVVSVPPFRKMEEKHVEEAKNGFSAAGRCTVQIN